jgi:hypothetical protein
MSRKTISIAANGFHVGSNMEVHAVPWAARAQLSHQAWPHWGAANRGLAFPRN